MLQNLTNILDDLVGGNPFYDLGIDIRILEAMQGEEWELNLRAIVDKHIRTLSSMHPEVGILRPESLSDYFAKATGAAATIKEMTSNEFQRALEVYIGIYKQVLNLGTAKLGETLRNKPDESGASNKSRQASPPSSNVNQDLIYYNVCGFISHELFRSNIVGVDNEGYLYEGSEFQKTNKRILGYLSQDDLFEIRNEKARSYLMFDNVDNSASDHYFRSDISPKMIKFNRIIAKSAKIENMIAVIYNYSLNPSQPYKCNLIIKNVDP